VKWLTLAGVPGADFATKWALRDWSLRNEGITRFDGGFLVALIAVYGVLYCATLAGLVLTKGVTGIGVALFAGGLLGNGLQMVWQGSASDWLRVTVANGSAWTNLADVAVGAGAGIWGWRGVRYCLEQDRKAKEARR